MNMDKIVEIIESSTNREAIINVSESEPKGCFVDMDKQLYRSAVNEILKEGYIVSGVLPHSDMNMSNDIDGAVRVWFNEFEISEIEVTRTEYQISVDTEDDS